MIEKEKGQKDNSREGENTKTIFGNQFENSNEINNFIEKYTLLKLILELVQKTPCIITIKEIQLEILKTYPHLSMRSREIHIFAFQIFQRIYLYFRLAGEGRGEKLKIILERTFKNLG